LRKSTQEGKEIPSKHCVVKAVRPDVGGGLTAFQREVSLMVLGEGVEGKKVSGGNPRRFGGMLGDGGGHLTKSCEELGEG